MPLQFLSLSHFAPSHGHCHTSSVTLSMTDRMCFTLFIYIHFRGGSSSISSSSSGLQPIFPSLHQKAAVHGYPTPLAYPSYNLIESHLLHQPTNIFNNVLYALKSCEVCLNSGRHMCHTPFKQYNDTSSQAAVMLLLPFKMMNEHQRPLTVLSDLSNTLTASMKVWQRLWALKVAFTPSFIGCKSDVVFYGM